MSRLSILIVDDDGDYRQLLRRYLTKLGHQVLEAHTGADGLTSALRDGVDAIVVDGHLPDTHGLKWVAELRLHGQQAPVVLASSALQPDEVDGDLVRKLGILAVLTKPVGDLQGFASLVETLLRGAVASGSHGHSQ